MPESAQTVRLLAWSDALLVSSAAQGGYMSTCPNCNREHAASYALWQCSDTTCGMSPDWNEDGESHDDCINECLYASRNRLRAQLSLATAEIAALKAVVEASSDYIDELQYDRGNGLAKPLADTIAARDRWDAAMAKLKETEA